MKKKHDLNKFLSGLSLLLEVLIWGNVINYKTRLLFYDDRITNLNQTGNVFNR